MENKEPKQTNLTNKINRKVDFARDRETYMNIRLKVFFSEGNVNLYTYIKVYLGLVFWYIFMIKIDL